MFSHSHSVLLAAALTLCGGKALGGEQIRVQIPSAQLAGDAVSELTVAASVPTPISLESFTIALRIVRGPASTGTLEFFGTPSIPSTNYLFSGGSNGFVGVVHEPTLAGAFDVAHLPGPVIVGNVNLARFTLRTSTDFGGTWTLLPELAVLTASESTAPEAMATSSAFVASPAALDANNDLVTDPNDHAVIADCFTGSDGYRLPGCEDADLDGDYAVDCRDLSLLRSIIGVPNCSFGDLECDLDKDQRDASWFIGELRGPGAGTSCWMFDSDSDGDLDLADFARFQNEYFPFPRPNKFWAVDASGLWHEPGNWNDNAPPIATDVVEIDRPAGDYSVTVSQGTQSCRRIESTERLIIAGGTLDVGETIRVDNHFKLGAGRIVDATILPGQDGQGIIPPTNAERGTLRNVTLSADCVLDDTVAGNVIQLEEGFTLNGVMQMSPGPSQTFLTFLGTGLFGGSGELVFGTDGAGIASIYGPANLVLPWTIGPDLTIRGGAGRLQGFLNRGTIRAEVSGQQIQIDATGPSNEGTIEAVDGGRVQLSGNVIPRIWSNLGTIRARSGGVVTLRDDWTNLGTIFVEDATLNLGGSFSPGDVGIIERIGATQVYLTTGTFDLAGGTFTLGPATGTWVQSGGTIKNGTLTTAAGRTLQFATSGALDGITIGSDLAIQSGQSITIVNGLTLNASLTIGGSSSDENATLFYRGNQTLAGIGEIVFAANDAAARNFISSESGSPTLTIGADLRVKTGTGSGRISGPTSGSGGVIVEGEIRAETPSTTVAVEAGFTTNLGRMTAQNTAILNSYPSSGARLFTNEGHVFVGPGSSFSVGSRPSSFVQTSAGQITIQIGGTTDASLGRLLLSSVTFAGTLNLQLADGYAPPVGTTIKPIHYESHTGTFDTVTGTDLGNGRMISLTYGINSLQLEVVEP